MGGIRKVDNKVKVGGENLPWGGSVIDLQYSISFEGPSSLSVTVVNSSGEYDTPALNASIPLLIEFGSAKMNMLPTAYRKSKGAGGRTLKVDFDDMSVKYLDKYTVLLHNQHLSMAIGGSTIVLGNMYAEDSNGVEKRYYGSWKSGIVTVKYDIADLAMHIASVGIPISERFSSYLSGFGSGSDGGDCGGGAPNSFSRSDVGSLRDVLSTVSGELGFVFFWNNADGIDETFEATEVINYKANEGFLDFVGGDVGNPVNNLDQPGQPTEIERIEATAEKVANACNVEDDSYEVSLKEGHIKGGIGFLSIEPSFKVGGASRFHRMKFQETVNSPYNDSKVNIRGDTKYEVAMLMKAAMAGPAFYAKYVMLKLTASSAQAVNAGIYKTLKDRDQGGLGPFDLMGQSIKDEGGEGGAGFGIVRNSAVEALYGTEFNLLPCVYSKPHANWRSMVLPPLSGSPGEDPRWELPFKDAGFRDKLRSLPASEFVGVAYENNESIRSFLADPEQCPIYRQLRFLAENYGRWYSLASSLGGGGLIVEEVFKDRNYTEDLSWIFSDLAVTDTPMADVYQFTKTEEIDYELTDFKIVLAGSSNCGNISVPSGVIAPKVRTTSGKGYRHIIGIRSMLHSPRGADSELGRTTCKGGAGDGNFVSDINNTVGGGGEGAFVTETLVRRSNRDSEDSSGADLVAHEAAGLPAGSSIAKSITAEGYGDVQSDRGDCNKPCEAITSPVCPGENPCVVFKYPTDRDYGVVIYDAATGPSVGTPHLELAFSDYENANSAPQNDLWKEEGSAFFALEVVQYENFPREKSTSYGRTMVDYLDNELDNNITLAVGPGSVSNSKLFSYSYTMDYLLQSVRAAYIPNAAITDNFNSVVNIEVEEVQFSIGELVTGGGSKFEFPTCDEGTMDLAHWNEAVSNLSRIMQNYVEVSVGAAISRDFVISGYGFNLAGGVCPPFDPEFYLPSIFEGLESISMSLGGAEGVRTTVKIGNKRRKRASATLRREMIVKGMPVARSRAKIPSPINNAFSVGLQTKL